MKNKIGVMQGRLLPKYKGRYQAHPVGNWQKEFEIAQEIKLDCIEFIFDFNDYKENPLLRKEGVLEIQNLSNRTGVEVRTICADYFMEAPLHSKNPQISKKSQKIMMQLLDSANQLGITDIVIPCVDQSSLDTESASDRFVTKLTPVLSIAEKYKINLSLETDLDPQSFIKLLNRFDSDYVTVNYDIGNSASLGYDPIEELDAYGYKITDIHIKDRKLNGGPVTLGKGEAKFDLFFNKLKEFDYQGPFIMQAYRDDEGIDIFKQQLQWISPYINQKDYI
jgi:L-ribulose-5-phosphate 3-epimerase UlaE